MSSAQFPAALVQRALDMVQGSLTQIAEDLGGRVVDAVTQTIIDEVNPEITDAVVGSVRGASGGARMFLAGAAVGGLFCGAAGLLVGHWFTRPVVIHNFGSIGTVVGGQLQVGQVPIPAVEGLPAEMQN